MNRPIKFRGRAQTIEPGKIVYGDIIHVNGEPTICDQFLYQYYVDADSIAQLVGLDRDGREVYEGDYVYVRTNRGNITFKPATMIDIHLVHTYKLKEAPGNA